MVRFMHISDTHLGSVQYNIPEREQDFYDTFQEAIDIAIDREVNFIIHAGDLFDSPRPSNRALRIVEEQMIRLQQAVIPVFTISGDHDRPRVKDNPSHILYDLFGMNMLGMDGFESTSFGTGNEEVFIGGIGNMKIYKKEYLVDQYNLAASKAKDAKKSVLISHQGVSPLFPAEQSEVTEDDLPVNYNYMAFGHVHQFKRKSYGNSIFSYSGSTEVKSTNEIPGLDRMGKGVNIVDLQDDKIDMERVQLTKVRPQYEISGTVDEFIGKIESLKGKDFIKKPIITPIIKEKPRMDYLKQKILEFKDEFIIRQPRVDVFETSSSMELSMDDKLPEVFRKYFNNEKKGDLALGIYTLVRDGKYTEEDIINIVKEISDDH